jgi:beta-D-xylosidase 4
VHAFNALVVAVDWSHEAFLFSRCRRVQVRWADAVVLAVGTDTISVEHEGTDRREVGLPGGATGPQHNFSVQVLQAAAAAKIPVVLVLCNGGAVSIDTLLLSSTSPAAAIEAFFPGFRGAEAIARHVFGLDNRWGRLPYDILSSTTAQSYDLTDYSMHNRSYRYLPPTSEAVTYPFGWGLSLSSFTLEMAIKPDLGNQTVCVRATNTGQMAGDVVIMAYFRPVTASAGKSSRKLLKQLWEFRVCSLPQFLCSSYCCRLPPFHRRNVCTGRLMLQPRARADVFFEVTPEDLQLVNEAGQRVVTKGSYELSFSIGDGSEDVKYQFHV